MDPKTMKREHDEAKRALSAEREAHRATQAKVEELQREIAPLRLRVALTGAMTGIVESLDAAVNRAYSALASVDHHESANRAIAAKDSEIQVLTSRITFLEGQIAGFRRDAIEANKHEDRALARADAAERRVRDLFHRLTKDLAHGWQGRSLRDLMADPTHARQMHVLLQRVIDWLNEEAQRPEPVLPTALGCVAAVLGLPQPSPKTPPASEPFARAVADEVEARITERCATTEAQL